MKEVEKNLLWGIERSEEENEDKTERKENINGDWAQNDTLEMENLLTIFYSITLTIDIGFWYVVD